MNISKIYRKSYGALVSKFRLSHSAVSPASTESEIEPLKKQDPQNSKNIAGISIVATENYSPLTNVSVFIKAGSRYEDTHNLGISHCLRNCAILSSKNHSSLALTRHLEIQGSKLIVSSTREYIIYTLQCIRDNMDTAVPALAEFITQQALKPWEVSVARHRMDVDLAMLKSTPDATLMEALHKVSLRGGLEKSLYSPEFMLGKHNEDMLRDYINDTYVGHRTVIAGLGVTLEQLEPIVNKRFEMKALSSKSEIASKFGGGEIRIDADLPVTRVIIAAEGASLTNSKEFLSLGVLQCILGAGAHIKGSQGEYSKIGAAAAKATDKPFVASSLNIGYSDVGMFGVYIAGCPNQMREIVKSVITQMRETTKKVTDEEIKNGKHALKAKLLFELEASRDSAENMALQIMIHQQLKSSEEIIKAIDDLTAADINAVSAKIMKTKPGMAALGQLHSTPYLDELL